jgi:uncharacterized UPF0146 family protein
MGDSNRFLVFAKFIARNYKPCKVADVAGGIGLLSHYLKEMSFDSTVIDPIWNGIESHGSPNMTTTICRFFQRHNLHYSITTLPMSGKNTVIWT